MKRILFTLFIIIGFHAFTQTNHSITGQIVDSSGAIIQAGNVVIRNEVDSTLITGTSFFDGVFLIENIPTDRFLMEVSSFGYIKYYRIVELKASGTTDLGTILLQSQDIEGVTISAFKSRITRSPDKLTVDVESSMLSSSNSILELLSHTPNVLVFNGNVTVFGKGNPIFYLDNQRVTLDLLKAVPVSQVKSIEVITTPSARYDSDGAAVIRIISKNFNKEGFQVDLKQNFRQGFGFKTFSEAGLNYRKGKFSLKGNYNIEIGKSKKIDKYTRNAVYDGGTFSSSAKTTSDIVTNNKSSYLLGLSYDLTKKSVISLQYNGRYEGGKYNLSTENDVFLPAGNSYSLSSLATLKPSTSYLNRLSLNYELKLDSLGSNLTVGSQYSLQKDDYINHMRESYMQTSNPLWQKQIDYSGEIGVFTGNATYELNTRKSGSFVFGGKYSSVSNRNTSYFAIRQDDNSEWITYPSFVSRVKYDEEYIAGFAEYSKSFKKIQVKAGLRSEYTSSDIRNQTGAALIDTTYLNLFPNASVTFKNFTLSYSKKINRVPFDYLNTNMIYVDSFSVSTGNPTLKPTYYNSIDLNYASIINIGYAKVKNEVQQFFIQDTVANRTLITFDNVKSMDRFTASVVIPIPSKKFTAYVVSGCNYLVSSDARFKESGISAKPQYYVYAYGAFNVGKLFKLQIIGQYVSGSSNGISSLKSFGNLDVSVSKNFLKDKFTLEIYGGDLFRNTIYIGNQYSQTATAGFHVVTDTRFVRLGLKYNFGRLSNPTYKVNNLGKEEQDRIKKGN